MALAVIHKKVALSTVPAWASTVSTERGFVVLVILRICLVAAVMVWSSVGQAIAAPSSIGIVLMHGTAGIPLGSAGRNGRVIGGGLVDALRKAGYRVETPEMCWSGARIYDRAYADCFADVDAAIARLRAQGATAIVVGGMSMGGNAAIGYAVTHTGLLGVIACAPAHDPALFARKPDIAAALAQATAAVAGGTGDRPQTFPDFDGSKRPPTFSVRATPRAYVSFFDPEGPANVGANAARLTVPIIWVAGTSDPSQSASSEEFARIPANPLSKYVSVDSGHLDTPDVGANAIVNWMRALSAGAGT
jgi:pimeloyl-ACP methyl ester carboxylesterase